MVDVFQTGSGTSTNMNANEVIARLAGAHPNDHVNQGQSSNDVIPDGDARLGGANRVITSSAAGDARAAGRARREGARVPRRHQDRPHAPAGRRAHAAGPGVQRLRRPGARRRSSGSKPRSRASTNCRWAEQPSVPDSTRCRASPQQTIALLSERTGLPFREARNHFEAQASKDAVVFLSAALRNYAVAFTKIANDIRWLGSGPRCGLGELKLPATQPGSSIMPGKVNPVIAESVLMVCAQVIGYDATIAWCGAQGNFELNVMMPVMAYDLLQSIELLAAASRNFETKLLRGLEADRERATSLVEQSLAMVTVLAPVIGYEKAAAISKEAYATGRTVREVAREKSGLDEERLNELLNPESQAGGAAE